MDLNFQRLLPINLAVIGVELLQAQSTIYGDLKAYSLGEAEYNKFNVKVFLH